MKSTKITADVQRSLARVLKNYPIVRSVSEQINMQGGRALLVGGAVRDLLLGLPIKDLDIEVHSLTLAQLQTILKKHGTVALQGKSFGVLRVHGVDVDWSLPRADSAGRKPRVVIDPYMPLADAFARRDLTINAMGIDLQTKELVDPWHGLVDLKKKILRAPNPRFFIEDPLRLFRVMQLMSRFEMEPDAELTKICKKMDISSISRERIEQEFEKLLLKSKEPSRGIRWLQKIGRLKDILPELAATVGIEQGPEWHPEGDVFEHSMQAVDAAVRLNYNDQNTKLLMMYTALVHDLGKVSTTKMIDGRIRSLGHAQEGVALAKKMLGRITKKKELIAAVQKLVDNHMAPGQLVKSKSSMAAYKRLAAKLAPDVTLDMLADLMLVDRQGRNPEGNKPFLGKKFPDVEQFRANARKAHVLHAVEKPILQGRDLLDEVPAGPRLGVLVKKAYEIQLDEGITQKSELKKRVLGKKR